MPPLSVKVAAVLATCTLLLSGFWYTRDASYVRAAVGDALPIRKPLARLPLQIAGWKGQDVPLDETVVKIAGATDYINRRYSGLRPGEMLNLYISYYGNPRTTVMHYPDICYPSAGWKKLTSFTASMGNRKANEGPGWPAMIYRFEKSAANVTVISFFNVGGRYTADRDLATQATHRAILPAENDGNENRNYLLQVQITFFGVPPTDRVVQIAGGFLAELVPLLETHLPASAGTTEPSAENRE